MHKYLIKLHRWIGLSLLLYLLFQAATGILLTYDHAIDEYLNPKELIIQSGLRGEFTSVDNIVRSVYSGVPDVVAISSLRKPRHENTVFVVYPTYSEDSEFYGRKIEVLLNPYTAEITGVREWGQYFTSFVYALHSTLLSGESGKLIIGWIGVLLFISFIIGLYLAWPKTITAWRFYFSRSVSQRKQSNHWRKRHVQVGLLIAPFLCLTFLSGIGLSFHNFMNIILDVPQLSHQISIEETARKIHSIDSILSSLQSSEHQYEWQRIKIPSSLQEPVMVNLRGKEDPRQSVGSSSVAVDISTGKLVDSIAYTELNVRQKLAFWFFPLHNGEILNHFGKLIIILTGFGAIWLVVTAFLRFIARKSNH